MPKGYLALIGGGTDCSIIFNRIFELAGGKKNTNIAIIPSASPHIASTISDYEKYFIRELGLDEENIWSAPIAVSDDNETKLINEATWKDNAYHLEIAEKIINYNVIFFVGGDQRKYIDSLRKNNIESPLLLAIEGIYNNGGIIAGTSAGTNILCKNSIAGGTSEEALHNKAAFCNEDDDGNKLLILNGLGFIENIVFDTHFETRGRLGRLAEASLLTNNRWGLGISEKTAVIFHPDSTIEIIGYGDVLLIDLQNARNINKNKGCLHVRDILVNLFTHGDKYNLISKHFEPYKDKESIINTPFFDANDYHISLNVFKKHETSHILINYMLDNEAKDVIALVDYEDNFAFDKGSSFIRYVETEETQAWYCKMLLEGENEALNCYSGTNILLDFVPLHYLKEVRKPRLFNAVLFGIENDLQVIVYDNVATLPICDAKIFIYDTNGNLLFKKGSDRYGRSFIRKIFKSGDNYSIRITYDGEEKSNVFTFYPDMEGICLY